jgi:protein TonB
MPTETLPTRREVPVEENVRRGFVTSVIGHATVVGVIFGATWVAHRLDPHWGDADPTIGSIQASMVNSLPLPPRQRFKEDAVLTSDKPSIAPTPPPPTPATPTKAEPVKPKSEPPPKPDEILIPKKTPPVKPTPAKPAEREQPVAPKRATPPPPPTPKATTGDTAGVQIPQSVTNLKNGTATVTVEERAFGDRYAYYVRLISQKINQSKEEGGLDPPDAKGKRTAVRFVINRDGTPTNVEVVTRSGSSALDLNTLRAIQRIDSFGPLPSGNSLTVTFGFSDER